LIVLSTSVITMGDEDPTTNPRGVAVADGKILELVGEDGIEQYCSRVDVVEAAGIEPGARS
jgi:hypothetical protein